MNNKLKTLTLTLLLSVSLQAINAQELSSAQVNALKNDDVALVKKEFTRESYDQCFEIKESSYNILAIAIKMDKPQHGLCAMRAQA